MRGALRIRAWSATSVGMVREGNEDSYFHGSTAFAVADGMGGHVAGEVASATALDPISALDGTQFHSPQEASEALSEAVISANTTVFEKAAGDPELRGMGTTLTALLVREGRFHLAHVGDSRAYLLRPNERISRLTTDHTLVQQLIDEKRLEPEDADTHPQRSVITRAIGVERHVEVEQHEPYELLPGDQILLCSDGLTGPVKDDEITRILTDHDDGQAACQALVDAANAAGGPDNITVVLLRVDADPLSGSGAAVEPPAGGSASNGRSGNTADLGSPISLAGGSGSGTASGAASGTASGSVTQIRTREDQDANFNAAKMGRYGVPQGATGSPDEPRLRRRRLLVRLFTVMVLLTIVTAAGGYLLWSRTYFVGDHSGRITIFRGVRQQVSGLLLREIVEKTDIRTADLPPPLRNQIVQDGVRFSALDEARQYANGLLRGEARKTRAEQRAPNRPNGVVPNRPDSPGPAPSAVIPQPVPTPQPRRDPQPTPTAEV